MTFTYLGNKCPICEGDRTDCRKSETVVYCLSGKDAPDGYWFAGLDKNLLFGKYRKTSSNSKPDSPPIEKRQKKQKSFKGQRLSIVERDRHYRRIAYQLGLTQNHRKILKHRGFSDSDIQTLIDQQLIFSWGDGTRIPALPDNLPGVDQGKLRRCGNRIAIAVPNCSGEICGIQIYRPNQRKTKYIWLSSEKLGGYGPQLPSEEMPIAVHGSGDDLWLCDSVAFKPIVAAKKHGIRVAGSTGGQFFNRKEQLTALVGSSNQIIYAPDAGDVQNKHMLRAIEATYLAIAELGKEMAIAWWGQVDKAGLDIDEVPTDQINIISWLDWQQIVGSDDQATWHQEISRDDVVITNDPALASQAQQHCFKAFNRASFWDYQPKNKEGKRELDPIIRKFFKNRRIVVLARAQTNPYQHFMSDLGAQLLGSEIEFEGNEVFALSISPKGDSITAFLRLGEWWKIAQNISKRRGYKDLTQHPKIEREINHEFLPPNLLIDKITGDVAIESLTGTGKTTLLLETQNHIHKQGGILIHLSFLDSALAETSEVGDLTNINQLDQVDWRAAEHEGLQDLSLNFQALFKLSPERIALIPPHSLIFIDEFSGAMKELAQASTLKAKRDEACTNLIQLIRHVKCTGGRVVVAQNRIFKIAIDAFTALTGLPLTFIQNKFTGKPRTVTFAKGSLKDFAAWIDRKRDRGIKIMNPSASQTLTERLCKVEHIRGRNFLRLDKKTRDQHKAFYASPSDYIEARNPGLFSYTATWGLGGNLQADQYFDELITAGHALSLESNVQAVARDRSGMDLTIFTLEAQPLDFQPCFAEQILYRSYSNARKTLLEHYSQDAVDEILKPSTTSAILDQLAAQFQAMENYEKQNLQAVQAEYYQKNGHTLKFIKLPKASVEFTKTWDMAIESCIEEQTSLGVTAPTEAIRDEEHASSITSSSQTPYQMKVAAYNWHLKQQLPGAPMRDRQFYRQAFVENNGSFYRSARLVWGAINPEAMKKMEQASIEKSIQKGECVSWALRHEYRKCILIKELGLLQLVNQEYCNSSDLAQEIHQKCIDRRNEIQSLLKLCISPHESISRTLNKLVKRLGYAPIQTRSMGARGQQQRVYMLIDERSQTRKLINEALSRKASSSVSANLEDPLLGLESHAYESIPRTFLPSVKKPQCRDQVLVWWEFSQKWVQGTLLAINESSSPLNFKATVKISNGLDLKIWDPNHVYTV